MPLPPGVVLNETETLPPSRYLVEPAQAAEGTPAAITNTNKEGGGGSGPPTARRPFMSLIVKNERLTSEESDKEVRHFELDLEGSHICYRPGDIVAIQPRNSEEQVQAMAELCNLDPHARVGLSPNARAHDLQAHQAHQAHQALAHEADADADANPDPIAEPVCGWGTVSVGEVLARHLDFMATPRRRFFQLLPFFCSDKVQRERLEELASKDGRVDLYDYCHKVGRSALEVLRDFPAARPPLEYLMELIPALRPRLFSISSGPSCAPGRLSITVAIVDYKSKTLMQRHGVCTSFLKMQGRELEELGLRQDQAGRVPIWLKPGSLRLPKRRPAAQHRTPAATSGAPAVPADADELATPLILVGPGTGIAPLRAFLQERSYMRRKLSEHALAAPPPVQDLLFFGCRRSACDWLYRGELEALVSDKQLAHLGVAFSRDQPQKVYVQHKIREAGALVYAALEAGGVIMISGSSEKMPQDVREAFVDVVEEQSQSGRQHAEDYIKHLESQRRYLQDTWS